MLNLVLVGAPINVCSLGIGSVKLVWWWFGNDIVGGFDNLAVTRL